jgi:hypothetical protein
MKIISLGAGVQSTTLILLAMRGLLGFGTMPEGAIFADTGWEPAAVYQHLRWLQMQDRIPVHIVSAGNIRRDALNMMAGTRSASLPFHLSTGQKSSGMLRRQCTNEYKIRPIRRWINRRQTELWIGISTDEAHRMRDSGVKYITNRYPLIELGMSRHDCAVWLERNGFLVPPKSSCIGCPFHDDATWRRMKDEDEASWVDAVSFDASMRHLPRIKGEVFLHRSLMPLGEVDLSNAADHGQSSFDFDIRYGFASQCDEGMCGV